MSLGLCCVMGSFSMSIETKIATHPNFYTKKKQNDHIEFFNSEVPVDTQRPTMVKPLYDKKITVLF